MYARNILVERSEYPRTLNCSKTERVRKSNAAFCDTDHVRLSEHALPHTIREVRAALLRWNARFSPTMQSRDPNGATLDVHEQPEQHLRT